MGGGGENLGCYCINTYFISYIYIYDSLVYFPYVEDWKKRKRKVGGKKGLGGLLRKGKFQEKCDIGLCIYSFPLSNAALHIIRVNIPPPSASTPPPIPFHCSAGNRKPRPPIPPHLPAPLLHLFPLLFFFFFYLNLPQPPLTANAPLPTTPGPPAPPPLPPPTGLFLNPPPSLTPATTFSSPVSTTTPPTIISPRTACKVSKLKIKSNSQTFSNNRSRASTKTWIKSSKAKGDSVEVEIRMKYNVA